MRAFLVWIGVLLLAVPASAGEITLRVSLENPPDHVQVQMVQRFAADAMARSQGRLRLDVVSSANLFSDAELPRALTQGRVDMGVLGIWQLDRFAPDLGVFFLPSLYGREADDSQSLAEGPLGDDINRQLEQRLRVKVLGPWLDLGFAHLFTTTNPIRRIGDLAGQTLRVAGSQANSLRLATLGAQPVTIPWPDVRPALIQGSIGGLLTTYETIARGRLWEAGIRYAYEDREYFARYIPLMASTSWQRLPADLQSVLVHAWAAMIPDARSAARKAQDDARNSLMENGITITMPTQAERTATRHQLMQRETDTIAAIGTNPELAREADNLLRGRDGRTSPR